MAVKRGEVWLADLSPRRGSEQAGVRPVVFFTDATRFDENGSLLIHLGDEVAVHPLGEPNSISLGFASGDVQLHGTFEPANISTIPAPAALWAAATVLPMAFVAMRRRTQHVPIEIAIDDRKK